MPQNRVKAVARACERIDDADGTLGRCLRDDLRNVTSHLISERVLDGLETSTRQNADTALVPLLWWHAVKMNVVRVIEAVAPVLLDFPQLDELISLVRTE